MNVPKLRFKEFNDEYSNICLNSLTKKITTKNKDNFIKNVISNSAIHGLISQRDFFDKDIANNENTNNYYIIEKGNFVYNPRKSNEAPYGPINLYKFEEKGVISPLYLCFKTQHINNNYLEYYFKSSFWHRYIYLNGDSGARHDRVSIKDETFFEMRINIPSELEQTKIANFLLLLDKKIEFQTKKIEDLKLFKKGLIRSISKNIKSYKKINDMCVYANGTGYENYVNSDGNYKLISLNSLDIEGNLKPNCKKILIENPDTLLKDDIVMVLSDVGHGDFLGISTLIPRSNEYVLNQRMGLLRIKDNSDPNYIVNIINDNQKKFKILGQGSSQLNLSKEDILNVEIPYPEINVQVYYSRIFENASKLIYLSEEKLLRLNELKKGLIQNMFV